MEKFQTARRKLSPPFISIRTGFLQQFLFSRELARNDKVATRVKMRMRRFFLQVVPGCLLACLFEWLGLHLLSFYGTRVCFSYFFEQRAIHPCVKPRNSLSPSFNCRERSWKEKKEKWVKYKLFYKNAAKANPPLSPPMHFNRALLLAR